MKTNISPALLSNSEDLPFFLPAITPMTCASFTLIFLLTFLPLSSQSTNTAITLSNPISDSPRHVHLSRLAEASLAASRRFKTPTNHPFSSSSSLFSHSYGGYSISLSFGSPPQTLPLIMDTGSDLVWFPCTRHYLCRDCNTSATFIPTSSSSSKILGRSNPKCGWFHGSDFRPNCTTCPPYILIYGSGTTAGVLLSETLDLPGRKVSDFIVGCSITSTRQPSGIAGFGRRNGSLPSQLGLKKFSYCLLSRRFDDTATTSLLLLDWSSNSGEKTAGMSYTPFLRNPSSYYYVGLRRIAIGDRRVRFHSPETIVDSGTTFTFMSGVVFDAVAREVDEQGRFPRSPEFELLTGLRRCYNISGGKTTSFPEMKFRFKGGAEMKVPVENYLVEVEDAAVACLAIVSGDVDVSGGPDIILGSFQFQNFEVVFDLRNERFGFTRRACGKEG